MPQQSSHLGRLVEFYAKRIDQIEKQNTIKELQQNSNQRVSGHGSDSGRNTSKNQLFRSEFKLQNAGSKASDDDSVIAATVEGFYQTPPGSVYNDQGSKCRFRIKLDYTYNPALKGRSSLSPLNGFSLDSLAEVLQADRSNLPENYQLDILSKLKPMLHGLTEVLAGESGINACPTDLPKSQRSVSASVTPIITSSGKSKSCPAILSLHQASLNDTACRTAHNTPECEKQLSAFSARGTPTAYEGVAIDRTKSPEAYVMAAEVSIVSEECSAEITDPNLIAAITPLAIAIVASALDFLALEDVVKSRQSVQEKYQPSQGLQDRTLTHGTTRLTSTQAKQRSLASLGTTEEILIVDDDFRLDEEEEETLKVHGIIECSKTDAALTGAISMPRPTGVGGAQFNQGWLQDIGFDEDSTIGGLDCSWSTLESIGIISLTTRHSTAPVTTISRGTNDDSLLIQVEPELRNSTEHLNKPTGTSGRLLGQTARCVVNPSTGEQASSVVRSDDILFNTLMDASKESSPVNLAYSLNFGVPGSYMSLQQSPTGAPVKYSLDSALVARDRASYKTQQRVPGVSVLTGPQREPSMNPTNTKMTSFLTPYGSSNGRLTAGSQPMPTLRQTQPSMSTTNTKVTSLSPSGSRLTAGSQLIPTERSQARSQWSGGGPTVTSVMVRTVIPVPSHAVNTETAHGLSGTSSKVTSPVVLQDEGQRVSEKPNLNASVLASSPPSITRATQQEVNVEALGIPTRSMVSHGDAARRNYEVSAQVTTDFRSANGQTEVVTLTYNQEPMQTYSDVYYPPRDTVEEVREAQQPLANLLMPPITPDHPELKPYLDRANTIYFDAPTMDSTAEDSTNVYVMQLNDPRNNKLSVQVPPHSESKPTLKRTETPWASPGSHTTRITKNGLEAGEAEGQRSSKDKITRIRSTGSRKSSGKGSKTTGTAQSKSTRTIKVAVPVSNESDAKPTLKRRSTPWASDLPSSMEDVLETGAPPSSQRTPQIPQRGSSKGSLAGPQERAVNNRHNLLPASPTDPPLKRTVSGQEAPQSNSKPHNLQCVHGDRRCMGATCQHCGCGPVVRGCETRRWDQGVLSRLLPPSVPPTGSYPVRRLCRPTDILGRHHGYCYQLLGNPGVRQKNIYSAAGANDVQFKGANGSGSCGFHKRRERLWVQSNYEAHLYSGHDCCAVAKDAVGQQDCTDQMPPNFVATQVGPNNPAALSRVVWRRCSGLLARRDSTHMGGDGLE